MRAPPLDIALDRSVTRLRALVQHLHHRHTHAVAALESGPGCPLPAELIRLLANDSDCPQLVDDLVTGVVVGYHRLQTHPPASEAATLTPLDERWGQITVLESARLHNSVAAYLEAMSIWPPDGPMHPCEPVIPGHLLTAGQQASWWHDSLRSIACKAPRLYRDAVRALTFSPGGGFIAHLLTASRAGSTDADFRTDFARDIVTVYTYGVQPRQDWSLPCVVRDLDNHWAAVLALQAYRAAISVMCYLGGAGR